ncbi:hypothetical protein VHEMI08418 [[Torrubiella] hemipterigena]|uniref:Glutathione S-transferase n=1 Tax=[Torrubiella] hemipterigena TaxID=1531966 RepID=A0A0A1TNG5_9HYPO|nr:hypothetical protein VHEMI08418 [[Torrubiella] hemipterigena]
MSEPDAKRAKTDGDHPYELTYWPLMPGRGEFVRLLFEDTNTPFTDYSKLPPQEAVARVTELVTLTNNGDAASPPIFAVPALRHGPNVLLNQTPNILQYIAPRVGLAGNGSEVDLLNLNGIVLTLLDGFSNEVHETHHPVASSQYYEDQKPEAKKRAANYVDERLPKFLGYVQRVLNGEASGDGPWLYGGQCTYADLVLFQCIHGLSYAFPKSMEKARASGNLKGVFELYEAVAERPNIKAYMESDRRVAYSDGIYRHYPELEEHVGESDDE